MLYYLIIWIISTRYMASDIFPFFLFFSNLQWNYIAPNWIFLKTTAQQQLSLQILTSYVQWLFFSFGVTAKRSISG